MVAARSVMLVVLLVTPWLYGGVYESTQVWLFGGVAIALTCWMSAQLRRRTSGQLPLTLIGLFAAMALGLFQLLPMPESAVGILSPRAVQLRSQLVPMISTPDLVLLQAAELPLEREPQPITLRSTSTQYDLSMLCLAVAAFFLGTQLFLSSRSQLWLCAAAAVNGAALSLFGLIQKLTWNGQVYWIGADDGRGNPFAAFANRNNAAGYLNLCLAAALGLTVLVSVGDHAGLATKFRRTLDPNRSFFAARKHIIRLFPDLFDPMKLFAVGLAVCIIGGILCTLSRGGTIGLLGAGIMTSLLVGYSRTQKMQLVWIGTAALTGLGLVAWVGMYDSLVERLGTLADGELLFTEGRISNWMDALQTVPEFWRSGTGLGTYRDVYSLYQKHYDPSWAYYAENQYIQSLVDAGLTGLVVLLASIGLVALACWRLLKSPANVANFGIGVAATFALASQAIHGFFDFGHYVPANMLMFAVLCGIATARDAELAESRNWRRWLLLPNLPGLSVATAVALLVFVVVGGMQVRDVTVAREVLTENDFYTTPDGATERDLIEAIDALELVLERRPDDAEVHYVLAKAWVHRYRLSRLQDIRVEAPPEVDLDTLWEQASTTALHQQALELSRNGDAEGLQALRDEPLVTAYLRPALKHLLLARQACPILPKVHLRLAKLCVLAGDPADDYVHIERAQRLGPSDAYTWAECGLLHLQAGRVDSACKSWQHCFSLTTDYFERIVSYARRHLDPSTVVERVLPASPAMLIQLAKTKIAGETELVFLNLMIRRADALLDDADLPDGERHFLQASIHAQRGEYVKALAEYALAVKKRPGELVWRSEYAILLIQEGRLDEADEQARWCAAIEPGSWEYRNLVQQIRQARSSQ